MQGRELIVGVSGGVAAYKTAALVSRLVQAGAGVSVVMTAGAREFIGPATFAALSGRPVAEHVFAGQEHPLGAHIDLAARGRIARAWLRPRPTCWPRRPRAWPTICSARCCCHSRARAAGAGDEQRDVGKTGRPAERAAAARGRLPLRRSRRGLAELPATPVPAGWPSRKRFSPRSPRCSLACSQGAFGRSQQRSIVRLIRSLIRGPHPDHLRSDAAVPRSGTLSDECLQRTDGSGIGRGGAGRGARSDIVSGPVDIEYPAAARVVSVVSTEEMLAESQKLFAAVRWADRRRRPVRLSAGARRDQQDRQDRRAAPAASDRNRRRRGHAGGKQTAAMARRLRPGNRRSSPAGVGQAGTQALRPDGPQRSASHAFARQCRRGDRFRWRGDRQFRRARKKWSPSKSSPSSPAG